MKEKLDCKKDEMGSYYIGKDNTIQKYYFNRGDILSKRRAMQKAWKELEEKEKK